MALPKYDKSKRMKTFQTLPKGAYVVKLLNVKEEPNKSGSGTHLTIAFDIAEGEYKDFYQQMYAQNANEDKRWPIDAHYYLNVPDDNSKPYVWNNWNTFFADLEDSNNGFVFDSENLGSLKNKLIGGKFAIDQSTYNGNVYDHTKLRWTCVAEDVRNNKAGKMPPDKLADSHIPSNTDASSFFEPVPSDVPLPF